MKRIKIIIDDELVLEEEIPEEDFYINNIINTLRTLIDFIKKDNRM